MIFNPFDIRDLNGAAEAAQQTLSWAKPLLQDNPLIVLLVLGFIVIDILACCHKGVLAHQVTWLTDTRNSRTFEASLTVLPRLRVMLMAQLFIFVGLTLFCILDPTPAEHLQSFRHAAWPLLMACIGLPLAWYLAQLALYNWFCYLFSKNEEQTIMNRSYHASWMLLAPAALIIYILQISGLTSNLTTLILLAALFILSQIAFIFNGFKIFYSGFGSLFLIIVYLCTLEIAPIAIICAKLSTQL